VGGVSSEHLLFPPAAGVNGDRLNDIPVFVPQFFGGFQVLKYVFDCEHVLKRFTDEDLRYWDEWREAGRA
jgi:hypothetical protein